MNKLIMTIGLPRSGKSTWARLQGKPVVNPDSIRIALHGKVFIPEAEPIVWLIAKYMVKSLFISGHNEVILDATNINTKKRNEWKNEKQWCRHFIIFNTAKDECMKRAINSNTEYLIPIIERMVTEREPISIDELGEKDNLYIYTGDKYENN